MEIPSETVPSSWPVQSLSGLMPASGPIQAINVPNVTPSEQSQIPPPQAFDENGKPIKIRKKPGRKPNPASPALRKAQNRAAQRAFRERKERHLRELENTIRSLREQRNCAVKELKKTKNQVDSMRAENWYLKGVMLTLQFVCLHYNTKIPPHSPYISEEALYDMAKTAPHAIESYVNTYSRNNIDLKPTMAAHFSNMQDDDDLDDMDDYNHEDDADEDDEDNDDEYTQMNTVNERAPSEPTPSHQFMDPQQPPFVDPASTIDPSALGKPVSLTHPTEGNIPQLFNDPSSGFQGIKAEPMEFPMNVPVPAQQDANQGNRQASFSAIQHLRLQLRLQSMLSNADNLSSSRLQPTILQLAIPHDPRIDLIPTPHMRDRMIIFRDIMDYDHCFDLLLRGAVYHGGDPTIAESWELPIEFFSDFWYLTIRYDINKTNQWRRLKGLPEISAAAKESASPTSGDLRSLWGGALPTTSAGDSMWSGNAFGQMPDLLPMDMTAGFTPPPMSAQTGLPGVPLYQEPDASGLSDMMNLMTTL